MTSPALARNHPGAAKSAATAELLEARGDYERCRAQVIEDLHDMEPDFFIAIENGRLIPVKALIQAVKENNDLGERHVRTYMNALERLHEHRQALRISR